MFRSNASNLHVLQWEEIKTKNSGAANNLCGGRWGIRIYCYCIGMTIMIYYYETHCVTLEVYVLKAEVESDINQDYI